MDFPLTISLGWWCAPAAITAVSLIAAWAFSPEPMRGGYFPDFGAALIGTIYFGAAIIVSLIAWLVWALLA